MSFPVVGSGSNVSQEHGACAAMYLCSPDAIISDYWDSYWILVGLIESELLDVANATLQNFMDEIETLGFIPNGGRIYCKPLLYIKGCYDSYRH